MNRIRIYMLFAVIMFCMSAVAQTNYMVAGTVMDEKGESLIGVTITDKDKKITGAVTDLDGKFRIKNVPNNTTLLFTYVGYKTLKYKVN